MNFKEIFEKLFSFDNSGEAIVFGGILLLTFLLGMVLWMMLFHWPQRRRLRKELAQTKEALQSTEKDYKDLDERYHVQSAKTKRLEEEAGKDEILISDQKNKLAQVQQLYSFLETERDAKQKQVEAAERELHELKNLIKIAQLEAIEAEDKVTAALKEKEEAVAKVEEMKGLMEEMEQDRNAASGQLGNSSVELEDAKRLLAAAQTEIEELQKNLKIAQDKIHIIESQDSQGLANENSKLHAELINLQTEIVRLEQEKTEVDKQLLAYLERDAQQTIDSNNASASNREMEELVNENSKLHAELINLQTEIIRLEEEKTEVDKQLLVYLERDAHHTVGEDGEVAIPNATPEMEELVNENSKLHAELINLQTEIIRLQEEKIAVDKQLLAYLERDGQRGLDSENVEAPIILDSYDITDEHAEESKISNSEEDEEEDDLWPHQYKSTVEQAVADEIGRTLPPAVQGKKDDLKRINGIGLLCEERLNYLGIFTYEQVSYLTDPVFNSRLTMVLGLPEGSIERDQWVAQAKQIITKEKINNLTKDINLSKLFKK